MNNMFVKKIDTWLFFSTCHWKRREFMSYSCCYGAQIPNQLERSRPPQIP